MSKDYSNDPEPIAEHIPPHEPEDYPIHERFLRRRYGDGIMLSVQKEIEGMARLYDAIEDDLDEETGDELLREIQRQIRILRGIEDAVASRDVSAEVESRSE